jgi:hypothetical protein
MLGRFAPLQNARKWGKNEPREGPLGGAPVAARSGMVRP